MNKKLHENLSILEGLIATQKQCIDGNSPSVQYMHGMANGMILGHAILSNQNPKYIQRPPRPYNRIVRHKCCKSKRRR